MSKTVVITARIEPEIAADLDKLAQRLDRSRGWLVSQAIARYVKDEIEFDVFVQEGIDAADRGELISQEEMEVWFAERIARHTAAE